MNPESFYFFFPLLLLAFIDHTRIWVVISLSASEGRRRRGSNSLPAPIQRRDYHKRPERRERDASREQDEEESQWTEERVWRVSFWSSFSVFFHESSDRRILLLSVWIRVSLSLFHFFSKEEERVERRRRRREPWEEGERSLPSFRWSEKDSPFFLHTLLPSDMISHFGQKIVSLGTRV